MNTDAICHAPLHKSLFLYNRLVPFEIILKSRFKFSSSRWYIIGAELFISRITWFYLLYQLLSRKTALKTHFKISIKTLRTISRCSTFYHNQDAFTIFSPVIWQGAQGPVAGDLTVTTQYPLHRSSSIISQLDVSLWTHLWEIQVVKISPAF